MWPNMNINDFLSNFHVSQRMIMGIAFGILALVSVTLVYSIWQWHSDWSLIHQPVVQTETVKADEAKSLISSIPDNHIFGKSIGQMPITNLQMSVTGIVKMIPSDLPSKAYISIDGQPSKIFKAGDELPYGVKIDSITDDAVILEHDNRFEKLPLPREKLQFKPRNLKENN